jgi:hypothetical protein
MLSFCQKYFFTEKKQFNVQLLVEEVLKVVPLDRGPVDLALRYSEKEKKVSLELTMPQGVEQVLENDENIDDLAMMIIQGLCQNIEYERTSNTGQLRVCLTLKDK